MVLMSTFDESKHPRGQAGNAGQFTAKHNTRPSGDLATTASDRIPLSIAVLDHPDPAGGFDLAVEAPTGRHYLRDGVAHREDGPAYEGRDGTQEWRQNGELHRDGAPAIIHDDGTQEFWEHGLPLALP